MIRAMTTISGMPNCGCITFLRLRVLGLFYILKTRIIISPTCEECVESSRASGREELGRQMTTQKAFDT